MHRLAITVFVAAAALVLPSGTANAADQQFTLSADYSGLYPNADVTVPVTVHNPLSYDLAVHTADVRVGDASPTCTADNVVAHSFSGDVVVPAGRDGTMPIRMQMSAAAPDTCQDATFPLSFAASGGPANSAGPAAASGASGGFAFTGAEIATTALFGAAALALGGLLLATRRRRSGVPS